MGEALEYMWLHKYELCSGPQPIGHMRLPATSNNRISRRGYTPIVHVDDVVIAHVLEVFVGQLHIALFEVINLCTQKFTYSGSSTIQV